MGPHMAKTYKVWRSNDHDLRQQISVGLDELSERLGGPDNPDELVPPYDADNMRWRSVWQPGQYYEGDTVRDTPYTMIANKDTIDRAAPVPIGVPTYTLPTVPAWAQFQNASVVESGHQYIFSETIELRSIRVWVPEVTATTTYRVVLIANPNGANPLVSTIEDPILNVNDWTVLGVDSALLVAGTELLVYIQSVNSGATTEWAYNWEYGGQAQTLGPGVGLWNTDNQQGILRINWLDAEVVPANHQLELQVVTGTIFEISEIGTPSNYRHFRVEGVYTEFADYTQYTVTTVDTGGIWPPPLNSPTQIRAIQPISDPTKFVGIVDNWLGNQPVWGTIQSFLTYGGVIQPVSANNAYGVDIAIQRLDVSADWDVVAYGGAGGGSGGSAGASSRSLFSGGGIEITLSDFWQRWLPAEKENFAKIMDNTVVPPGPPPLWPDVFRAQQLFVILNWPVVGIDNYWIIQEMNWLETMSVLGPGRASQILAP